MLTLGEKCWPIGGYKNIEALKGLGKHRRCSWKALQQEQEAYDHQGSHHAAPEPGAVFAMMRKPSSKKRRKAMAALGEECWPIGGYKNIEALKGLCHHGRCSWKVLHLLDMVANRDVDGKVDIETVGNAEKVAKVDKADGMM